MSTRQIAGSGRPTHSWTVSKSAPTRPINAITNHRTSGTSAAAVTRCSSQCSTPSFADPRPIARPSGERIRDAAISADPARDPGDPGNHGQDRRRGDDDPAADVGGFEVKGMTGIPDQMPDTVAQMIEQRRAPAEQQDDPEPGADEIGDGAVGLRP